MDTPSAADLKRLLALVEKLEAIQAQVSDLLSGGRTARRKARQQAQGRYMSALRHATPSQAAAIKQARIASGMQAALELSRRAS